jgi:hypothetical protein
MGSAAGTFPVKEKDGTEHRFSETPVFSLKNDQYHHIGGFLTTTGIRHCDGLFSVCPNPATTFIVECLRAQVEGSIKASKSATGKRNAEAIIEEVAERNLSVDALRALNAEREKYAKLIPPVAIEDRPRGRGRR